MKKLHKGIFIAFILVLFMCGHGWCATLWTKDIGGTVYYDAAASSCDDVTAGDTSSDLEAAHDAAGAAGTVYVCAGTYSTTELDADGELDITLANQTWTAVGTVTLVGTAGRVSPVHITGGAPGGGGLTFTGFSITVADDANNRTGIVNLHAGVTIDQCTITGAGVGAGFTGYIGIDSIGTTFTYTNNIISGLRIGIRSQVDDVGVALISGNTISDLSVGSSSGADGMLLADADGDGIGDYSECVVTLNDISGYMDDGIDLIRSSGAIIRKNTIHDNGAGADGQGIKAGGAWGNGNIIDRNTIYNITSNDGISTNGGDNGFIRYNLLYNISGNDGIDQDTSSTGWTITNNTVIMAAGGVHAMDFGGSSTATLQNNIFDKGADGTPYDIEAGDGTITGGYNVLVNDAAPNSAGNYTNTGTSDQGTTDPLFVSATDFNLKPGSPARNAGTPNGSTPF